MKGAQWKKGGTTLIHMKLIKKKKTLNTHEVYIRVLKLNNKNISTPTKRVQN